MICRKMMTKSQTIFSVPVSWGLTAQSTIIQIQNTVASRPRIAPKTPHPPNAIDIESPPVINQRTSKKEVQPGVSNILQQRLDGGQALRRRLANPALTEIERRLPVGRPF